MNSIMDHQNLPTMDMVCSKLINISYNIVCVTFTGILHIGTGIAQYYQVGVSPEVHFDYDISVCLNCVIMCSSIFCAVRTHS